MKRTIRKAIGIGICYFVINMLITSVLISQNNSICPIGVGMEPTAEVQTKATSFVNEIYSPNFVNWNDVKQIKLSDDIKAKTSLPAFKRSRIFIANNFNFQLPAGAQISGISVSVEGQSDGYKNIDELEILLLDANGLPKGENKANSARLQKAWSKAIDGKDKTWMYGSDVDTWGTNWSSDDINSSNFGFEIQLRNIDKDTISIFMDKIDIMVHYTPLYSFCDAKCLTFYIDKFEQQGSYLWHVPDGFDMVSASVKNQTIDLKITTAKYGVYPICVDVFDYSGNYSETCCRNFSFLNCNSSEIKGLVWLDLNDNKTRDQAEGILSNVPLVIYNQNNTPLDTVLSGTFGAYLFTGLPEGKYYIKSPAIPDKKMVLFNPSVNPDQNSDITNVFGAGSTNLIQTEIGKCIENIDFGYTPLVTIGDFVWVDHNLNGLQDTLEKGIGGVKIYLINGNGSIVDSTLTSGSGKYSFGNLPANKYCIKVKIPTDYFPTLKTLFSATKNSKIDSTGKSPFINYISSGLKPDVDAGLYQKARIGDYVWEDKNGNGVQNIGEQPIADVLVMLTGLTGDGKLVNVSTTSDKSGKYYFNNVTPGKYTIKFVAPDLFFFTTQGQGSSGDIDSDVNSAGQKDVMVYSGDLNLNIDAGLFRHGSISNFVWEDLNANGIQEVGENGLSDVTVSILELRRDEFVLLDSVTTDINGYYIFDNLKPGSYDLSFSVPEAYMFVSPDVGMDDTKDSDPINGQVKNIMLMSGERNDSYDAGLFRKASLGDFVWEDLNGNGLQDIGEPGVANIKVTLNGSNDIGAISIEIVTDSSGHYLFTDLLPGNYNVQILIPDLFIETSPDQGNDDTNDSDGMNSKVINIVLQSGDNNSTIDFGLFSGFSIGDFIWDDLNLNGIQDGDEPGIGGVMVQLSGTFNNGVQLNLSAISDDNGKYIFNNIFGGSFTLNVDLPIGYTPTKSEQGGDTRLDSNLPESSSEVTLNITNNTTDLDIDFGLVKLGAIGDLVWEDLNCNGIRETNEPGVPGVKVVLSGLDFLSAIIDKITFSDQDGRYLFGNLKPGSYKVNFEAPTDYEFSIAMINNIELLSGENLLNVDAPLFKRASIGNFVWKDTNKDGIQNINEKGLPNVHVFLKNLFQSDVAIRDTFTDDQGAYLFNNLKPGRYEVSFEKPLDFDISPYSQGSDIELDSNIDSLGFAPEISLISGQSNLGIDAGFISIANAEIGDYVWEDINGNGLNDIGEPGIAGVKVFLQGNTMNGSLDAETITDTMGIYRFVNLSAGDYMVTVEKVAGYIFTMSKAGLDDMVDSDVDQNTGKSLPITLLSNTVTKNIDAALFRYGSIGNFVWNDLNKNGLQDVDEPGIGGIKMTLKDVNGFEIGSSTSNLDGFYLLSNIAPGTYTIVAQIPQNFILTTTNDSDENLNSDFVLVSDIAISKQIQIKSNSTILDLDLGLTSAVSNISGFAWFDQNGNGIKDTAEDLLDSIFVFLINEAADTLAIDTTGLTGEYAFTQLQVGTYIVQFGQSNLPLFTSALQGTIDVLDSDVTNSSTGQTDKIFINEGEDKIGVNAGYVNYSSLGDFIWVDTNENGFQEMNEAGLNGIKVILSNETGVVIDSTISSLLPGTMRSGFYIFRNLTYGNYKVNFKLPANFMYTQHLIEAPDVNSDIVFSDGSTNLVEILPNEQRSDIDAGYIIVAPVTGTINGRLWMDGNNNKIRDFPELPLIGEEVKLFKIDGTLFSTVSSGIDGAYSFVDIPFGDYYVLAPSMNEKLFVLYSGQSVPFDSDISNAFWPGSTRILTLFPGDTLEDIDLGYADKIIIGDFVWDDINNNGLQEIDEPGINMVTVKLINENGMIEKIVKSNNEGFFVIDNVPVGRYSLLFEKLDGFVFSPLNGTNTNINSKADEKGMVALTDFLIPQAYLNIDVGYVKAGSIGDNVWLDLNGNGFFQPGEPGIVGIPVKLYSFDGILKDSTLTIVQSGTQFSGYYLFNNVRPGMYFIKFDIPSNYVLSPSNIGGPESDSNITNTNGLKTTDIFSVGINEFVSNIDAGAYLPATLGDRVWDDVNMNGTQDDGEPGIAGITVSLFTQSGTLLDSKVTDVNGHYAFTGLRQRLYYVQFTIQEGFMFTEQNGSGNGATDSDVDQTGTTPLISLAHGSTFLDIDAGMHITNANLVMGTIWNDINKNGLRTEDESLLPMVNIYLKDANQNIIENAITNHAGMYCFATENTGQYFIFVEPLVDHIFTSKGSGTNVNRDSDVDTEGVSDILTFDDNYTMKYIDAGLFFKVSTGINGLVWLDLNNDGIRNSGDSLLADIVIFIFNKSNVFVKSVKSDLMGSYAAKNLDAGQYYCRIPVYDDKDFIKFTGSNTDIDSEITNQYGEGTSRLITLEVGSPMSNFDFGYRIKGLKKITPLNDLPKLEIYPNPSFWFINVNLPKKENVQYNILNQVGALVRNGTIVNGSGRISVEDLKTGRYILQVFDGTSLLSKSFMKIEN